MNSVIACHIDIGNDKLKQLGNALAGIELVHMMRKRQGLFASAKALSLKEQFKFLAA